MTELSNVWKILFSNGAGDEKKPYERDIGVNRMPYI